MTGRDALQGRGSIDRSARVCISSNLGNNQAASRSRSSSVAKLVESQSWLIPELFGPVFTAVIEEFVLEGRAYAWRLNAGMYHSSHNPMTLVAGTLRSRVRM